MNESLIWAKVAALAQVAGAVATFVAVVVALWIAHSERRAHIEARAGLRILINGDGSPFEDVISVLITNRGLRPVRVSSVGWRTGWIGFGPKWLTFQHAMQQFNGPVSSFSSVRPPFDLGPGQDVTLHLPPEPFMEKTELRDTFFNRRIPMRGLTPTKVCVVVSLVAAKAVATRVEKGLERFLATGAIVRGAASANTAADRRASK